MDNLQFQDDVVDKIQGWLTRVTSLRTMDILAFQEENEINGSLLEIGVFCGKYFSLLARSAYATNSKLLGIDTFEWTSESRVHEALALSAETASAKVTLWKKLSNECSPNQIISFLEVRPRFISIDGSHDCEDVFLDLELSEQILSSNGIVAVDDFLNPLTLGVNEAVHKFFLRPRVTVPVAYISNKLFLSHRSMADKYKEAIEKFILADHTDPQCNNFREALSRARHQVEQPLWSHKVLIC